MIRMLFLMMGMNEQSGNSELRRRYHKIVNALMEARAGAAPEKARRIDESIEKLSNVFDKAKNRLGSERSINCSVTGSGVLMGELLVDAGLITAEQLEEALETQAKMKPPLPIGRILVARGHINWEQLASFMKLDDLLQLPADHPQRFARQLKEIGLLGDNEIEMVDIDCETTGCSMRRVIERRGWISASILSALTEDEPCSENKLKHFSGQFPSLDLKSMVCFSSAADFSAAAGSYL